MRIACLGWGSLIWKSDGLRLKSVWKQDGPELPVEFARQSKDGRITLVICESAKPLPVLWAELECSSLDEAIEALRSREGTVARHIGSWSTQTSKLQDRSASVIAPWAERESIDGVVWTGLGPKFAGNDVMPSCDEVIAYLKAASGDTRRLAEEYIRKAPIQIATTYRTRIEKELGWTPLNATQTRSDLP